MTALKIRRIGNSAGVILPKDVLDRHNISPGDIAQISERGAELVITRHDDAFSRQMQAARHVMRRRFSALRELAK